MTETLAYDLDGNLADDARWHYSWDAENRLKGMETQPGAVAAGVPRQRLSFTYDSQHRRVRKVMEQSEAGLQPAVWTIVKDTRFVYDGWNLIAEFEVNQQSQIAHLKSTYAWGLDLSGTTTGAGGVGGLVSVTEYDTSGNAVRMLAPAYDTNGNLMAYADIATGAVTHRFEYDAFGIALTVTYSDNTEAPPFRFSTKYLDVETGLYYYGYRYYSPEMGRWLSRDPIGERGGLNLYGLVGNDAVNRWDVLGHEWKEYTGDVRQLTFKTVDSLRRWDSSAEAVPNWDSRTYVEQSIWQRISSGAATLRLEGKLTVTLEKLESTNPDDIDKVDWPSDVVRPNHDPTRSVKDHEQDHAEIFAKYWNAMVPFANSFEGAYCPKMCAELAEKVVRSWSDYYYQMAQYDQQLYDRSAYSRQPYPWSKARVQNSGKAFTEALQSFEASGCKKP